MTKEEIVKEGRKDVLLINEELKDILTLNQSIISNLKTQKARNDEMFEKYQEKILEEAERPANAFLHWVSNIGIYVDSSNTASITDFELMKSYEIFISKLIKYNHQYNIRMSVIDEKNDVIKNIVDKIVVNLELKIIKLKKEVRNVKIENQIKKIKDYQNVPLKTRLEIGNCLSCGAFVDGKFEDECEDCKKLDKLKPKIITREEVSEEIKKTLPEKNLPKKGVDYDDLEEEAKSSFLQDKSNEKEEFENMLDK